jgi:hypothetical protein
LGIQTDGPLDRLAAHAAVWILVEMSFWHRWARRLSLYFRSAQYLHPVQILARLALLWRRRVLYRPRLWLSRYTQATGQEPYAPLPIPALETAARGDLYDAESHIFNFLNRRLALGQPVDWFPSQASQLWLYNLHYFEYAVVLGQRYAEDGGAQAYQTFRSLVKAWIAACPVAASLAWDPYPTSLRLTNWLKAYTLFGPALEKDPDFATVLRRSLYTQARFLEDNLEHHLLGNHLIENGRTLLLAGLFFKGRPSKRWRRKGARILWQELHRQFLEDGGHYERSPMYHQMMLQLYQEVVSVLRAQRHIIPDGVDDQVQAMQDWLCTVLHPDGDIPLLNDTAFGIANHPTNLLEGVTAASEGLQALPDSGYFVFRDRSTDSFLIFDCGPLGPDYQPGHGHCDTLSYELSLSGQRIIVDSGVDNYYGELDWRNYYRSTRAHNTVVADGTEQSEIWNRFRVARRAYPLDVRWVDKSPALAYVAGSHTGYRRLKGKVIHRRWMCWIDRHFWLVCDRVTGQGWHQVENLIHFHPQIQVVSVPKITAHRQSGEVRYGQSSLRIIPWGVQDVTPYFGDTDPIQAWYAPEFGLRIRNHVWGLNLESELPVWFGYVLWPETTDVAVQFSSIDEQSCHVDVQSVDILYHIVFTPTDVTVEKEY